MDEVLFVPIIYNKDIEVKQRLTEGGTSPFQAAFFREILELFDIAAEGFRSYFISVAINQGGGQLGSVGDDLPAVQGVIPAEPLILPLCCNLATKRVTVFFFQCIRNLIEDPVQPGFAVQLPGCGLHGCFPVFVLRQFAAAVNCTDGKHRSAYGPAGIAEQTDASAETGCHLQDFFGKMRVDMFQNRLKNTLCTVEAFGKIFPRPFFDADNFFGWIHLCILLVGEA